MPESAAGHSRAAVPTVWGRRTEGRVPSWAQQDHAPQSSLRHGVFTRGPAHLRFPTVAGCGRQTTGREVVGHGRLHTLPPALMIPSGFGGKGCFSQARVAASSTGGGCSAVWAGVKPRPLPQCRSCPWGPVGVQGPDCFGERLGPPPVACWFVCPSVRLSAVPLPCTGGAGLPGLDSVTP